MKLIIADNTLESYQGHSFAYCESIKREAEKQGINVTILATQNVNPEVKTILNAVPFFKYSFFHSFPEPWFLGFFPDRIINHYYPLWNYYLRNKMLAAEMKGVLPFCPPQEDCIILFPNFTYNDFKGIVDTAEITKNNPNIHIAAVQHFTSRINLHTSKFPNRYYERVFNYLNKSIHQNRIHLFSDSTQLIEEYKKYTPKHLTVLPIPHTSISTPNTAKEPKKLIIGYMGDARTNKGFHLLPEALDVVKQNNPNHKLEFHIQANIRNKNEWQASQAGALLNNRTDTICYSKALNEMEYKNLMNLIDVFVLPYTLDYYHSQTSGVFSEARSLGKVTVATRGSWMADEISKNGGGILCSPEDPKDIGDSISKAITNYSLLKKEALKAEKSWNEFHNVGNYFKILTETIFSKSP
jgi:glycosyltransferase involved in cell wall biosynthesis